MGHHHFIDTEMLTLNQAGPIPVESTVFPSELSESRSSATTEKLSSSPTER